MRNSFVVISALLFGITHTASAAIWFVATNGNDNAVGTTWETAKQTIQAAIDAAASNDTVLVSNGVYATGERANHIPLSNRIVIDKPITVQSVHGPANTTIQGAWAVRCAYVGTNATLSGFTLTGANLIYPVDDGLIVGDGAAWCEPTAVISNCAITGNNADAGGGTLGGTLNSCMLISNSAVWGGGAYGATLTNCTLKDNGAWEGGGTYEAKLHNCILTGNRAENGGGAYGSTLNNCTLTDNVVNGYNSSGGGAAVSTLNNCTLIGNSAVDDDGVHVVGGGGASYCNLNNCTLIGNFTVKVRPGGGYGGGGGVYGGVLNNCTLMGNSADRGGGAAGSPLAHCYLYNCIIYGNTATNGPNYYSCTISYSCTMPDSGGMGNITNNPLFVDATAGNYRLNSNSPCIDRGANFYAQGATDLDGNPRIMNGGVDMGAYECQEAVAPRFGYWAWAAGITNGLTNYADCATGDEYPNLLKYASGSGATNTDDLARLADGLSNGLFRVRFNRNTNAQDVIIVVECSSAITNCAAWQGVATNFLGSWGGATNVEEFGDGSPVAVAVSEIEPTSNRIFRLRVHRP